MTLALHGIGISRGYAIGRTYVLNRDQPEVVEYAIPRRYLDEEVDRFVDSVSEAKRQLRDIRDRIPENVSSDITAFIDTHLLMLEDSTLTEVPVALIRERQCNAEWALKLQRDQLTRVFDEMEDPYLRTRRDDVDHVVNRILRILLRSDDGPSTDAQDGRLEGRVVVADDLTPADTVLMQHQGIVAFVTEFGGPLSHTAILARNLGIPAVIGARNARRFLIQDETIVVDGPFGVVLSADDDAILEHYRRRRVLERREQAKFARLRDAPAVTRDEVTIALEANIELPDEVEQVLAAGATGVGLYRTEVLFLNRKTPPDEQEQFECLRQVVEELDGLPLTIRTLDLGADKEVDGARHSGPVATNPALGLRGIRLCLREPELFRPQLRAILRASALGPVRLMIPMLSHLSELYQVKHLLQEAKQSLRREGTAFDAKLEIGAMIEVPAAAIAVPLFSGHLDFLSIGTNDLIQYTLAIDRIDDEVNYLYDPLHPAVLRLIHGIIESGRQSGIPVAMCGEMAGDPRYTRLLLGLGLRQFSMHPSVVPEVKTIVRDSEIRSLTDVTKRVVECGDARELPDLIARLAH